METSRYLLAKIFLMFQVALGPALTSNLSQGHEICPHLRILPRLQKGQWKRLALKKKLIRNDCGFVNLLFLIESL